MLYLIGKTPDLKAFAGDGEPWPRRLLPRNVMILGGGNAGFYLARHLQELGAAVKIIDTGRGKCVPTWPRIFENVLVIHGDGSDRDLLEEENLSQMGVLRLYRAR